MDDTSIDNDDEKLPMMPDNGDNVEVCWRDDDAIYPGTLSSINDDQMYIDYDDSDKNSLDL